MKKFLAQVDPDLFDLIPGFLQHKREDTHAILLGIARERIDFEELSRIGHKLKGEGGSYGLEPISIYGAGIELAARRRDAAAVSRYAHELAAYLDSLLNEDE
jgi:hypothetical protein